MYPRITRVRSEPSRMDEAIALNQDIIAVVRRQPGFQNAYLAADRTNGRLVAVSTWDTQEQAGASRDWPSKGASPCRTARFAMA
jgi:quinol monooxygenase YgiN